MPTWSGTAFTAFVAAAAYYRRIVGWCTAPSMPIELPLGALRMRVDPARAGQAVEGV
jgi:putative transposase